MQPLVFWGFFVLSITPENVFLNSQAIGVVIKRICGFQEYEMHFYGRITIVYQNQDQK